MTLKRLPDAELEVMKALWELGSDTPRSALEKALADFGWAANTINTYLSRLTEKGFLSVERDGRSNAYTPLISRRDYLAAESRDLLDKLYGGSLRSFAVSLCDGGVSREEIDELRRMLEEGELE